MPEVPESAESAQEEKILPTMAMNEMLKELDLGTPVDFSFKNLTSLDNVNENPRSVRVGRTPKRGPSQKFITRSVWLNNNNIEKMVNVDNFIKTYLEIPEELGWIDISFNLINDIDNSIEQFAKLKIIYLHGNRIANFDKLKIIAKLPNLRSLTLHGNPIEAMPNYRLRVIHEIPQLVNLDFSPIVASERELCFSPARQ